MNPVVLAIMAAILTAWIGIGVVVITYGTRFHTIAQLLWPSGLRLQLA
jgi:hypothetical protein